MTEPARLARNATKLTECEAVFRRRVERIIAALEADGYRPRIQQAWRSVDEQREMVRTGTSKVLWGFHNATAPDGRPEALAVDLIDDDHPVVPAMKYLLKVAAHARDERCDTGILWGLTPGPRERLEDAIKGRNWGFVGARGWDPLHIQVADVDIVDAKRGMRPREFAA